MKKWPAWFPYPSSYLRAISLFPFVLTTPIFSVFFVFEGLDRLAGLVLRGNTAAISPAFLIGFLLIALFGSLSPIICMTLHALFHHKVVSGLKGWWPTQGSWWLGVYATVTVNFAINIAIVLGPFLLAFFDVPYYRNALRQEWLIKATVILFFAIATILFQIEFLIRRRFFPNCITPIWKPKRSNKTKEKRIDGEIDELLKEMKGLKREANRLTDR